MLENKYPAVTQQQTAIISGLWESSAQVTGAFQIKLVIPVRNGTAYCTRIIPGWHYLMPAYPGLISILTMGVACAYETLVRLLAVTTQKTIIRIFTVVKISTFMDQYRTKTIWQHGSKNIGNHVDLLVFRNDKLWIQHIKYQCLELWEYYG
jgi:hypothetical protein